ncbi:hypothetical protein QH73_0020090 [Scytonema millei VB511283]|uniref:Clp R domain-containing protein n=1 Tax=Scytonema millei VB511283 TaxID=1245923 RepID=A0A9X5E7Y3_9CYAN|nr:Clp protease N-terminal domain-containing protein [Scytonema millei]NHC36907.1 hypothetical protein [Scytonema millei VB511283]
MVDFRNFSEKSIKVIMLAQEESRRMGHNFVGREQLLLGCLGAKNNATTLLNAAGVTLKVARAEVQKIIGLGSGFVGVEIPFTPNAKRALEDAVDISLEYRTPIHPEQILLSILNSEGVALRVVENLGVNVEQLKEKIRQEIPNLSRQSRQLSSEASEILKQVEELQKQVQETRIGFVDPYKPLQGEPAISPELKDAISTLARTKYRGIDRWKYAITYRFTGDSIQVRTAVREDAGGLSIEFTEEEAILIAKNLAGRQESSD